MKVKVFEFNAFQENTYVLYDDSGECIVIDPGCSNAMEQETLSKFIQATGLSPQRLINTHCHIDHVLGNKFVASRYNLKLEAHEGEVPVLQFCPVVSQMYGISYEESPAIEKFVEDNAIIRCGNFELITLFTPGHSPASLSFFHREEKQLISGDVLFRGSIGRTDLPGGDHEQLISSIMTKIVPLGRDVRVFPGHGPATTVGFEMDTNPFLNESK